MQDVTLQEKAALVLQWDEVLTILAGHARSSMGAERCRTLHLEPDLAAAQARLRETGEMVGLMERGDSFPSLCFPDPRNALGRVMKGASLEGHELRDFSIVLGLGSQVVKFLERRQGETPALCAVAGPLDAIDALRDMKSSIDRAVDEEGSIRESATPTLRRLSQRKHELKQQMRHRLGMILESRRYADVLQEYYFAQREGRYVVPVKAELRSKIPGIVHDVSASGATVFLEPRELVELNNAIKVAELEVEREVRRILRELSSEIAEHGSVIREALSVLATLDCIAAKAALGQVIKAQPVTLNSQGRIALRQARHPLLVLARESVVANDVFMDETVRVLVISGPNTGGKTVTLKIVGLFALMVRAGLQLPCAADSEMAYFCDVFADIGDPQDLHKDLSSFSAHMTQMIRLLQHASSGARRLKGTEPTALVLLDELVTSTDPIEGAALAEALLLELAKLRMKVVVTTHYNGLKMLAQTTPGFQNASVEFDVSTLSPTYRLIMGVPGGSSAIEIAGRLGMEARILEHAQGLLKREDQVLEKVLGQLQEQQRRLDADRTLLAELKAEAERSAREARETAERLRLSEREERRGVKKKLTEELLRARAEMQSVIDSVRKEPALTKAREAKEKLSEIGTQARVQIEPVWETQPLENLGVGAVVEIIGLGMTGILLEAPEGKKRIRIRVGAREMSVAPSQLMGLAEQPGCEERRQTRAVASVPLGAGLASSTRDAESTTVLDLRGKTAGEALNLTIAALDQATLSGSTPLRLIHGHGTGRLKAVLRDYLKGSPYVAKFRPGDRHEGGDGVTIVELT